MRTAPRIVCPLISACLCLPLLATAQQSQHAPYVVSVHELSIPPKAFQTFRKGAVLLAKDDPARSLPQFQRAIAEFPGYYEAYFEIGMANLKLSRLPDAESALQKSIALSGGSYAEPLFALGAVFIKEGKFADSAAVTRRALDLDPSSWAGHYCLAYALFQLNRLDEAEKSAREALRRKPGSADSLLLLADIHHRQRNYPALLSDLDQYLAVEPHGPAAAKVRALREQARRALATSQDSALIPPWP
jgi:tetratricopeptide (TPR) repeat protein